MFLYVSYFASQNKGIKFGDEDLMSVAKIKTFG